MLQCPQCQNQDEFIVTEQIVQRTRIACDPDGFSYTFVEEVEFLEVCEWEEITCVACGYASDEDAMRQCYDAAHGMDADGLPIPFTLVDASIT